jgi:hypothetical protein
MASSPLTPIVSAFDLTTDWQVLYQVPSNSLRVGIDAAVINNYSSSNVDYSVRITQDSKGDQLDEVISNAKVRAGQNNLAPAMIGQAVLSGGTIEAKASANNSVSVSLTATIIDS